MGKPQVAKMSARVVNAIRSLREVHGSTSKEIMNYIMSQHDGSEASIQRKMYTALKRGLEYGILRKTNGHYSLNTDAADLPQIPTSLAALERARPQRKGRGRVRRRRRRSRRGRSRRRGRGKGRGRGGRRRSRRGRHRSLNPNPEVTEAAHGGTRPKDAYELRSVPTEEGFREGESEDRRSRSQRRSVSRERSRSRSRPRSLREGREE